MLKIFLLKSDILINVQKNQILELEWDTSQLNSIQALSKEIYRKYAHNKINRLLNKFLG